MIEDFLICKLLYFVYKNTVRYNNSFQVPNWIIMKKKKRLKKKNSWL